MSQRVEPWGAREDSGPRHGSACVPEGPGPQADGPSRTALRWLNVSIE